MIFGSTDLAKRIETAQAQNQMDYAKAYQQLLSDSTTTALRLGSAAALYAGVESPLTQSFGLGMDGEVEEQQIEAIEEFFFSRGAATHVEVANLADMSLTTLLGRRGYAVCEYSHVLGFDLQQLGASPAPALRPYRLEATELEAAAEAIAAGFMEQNIGEGEIPQSIREMFVVSIQTAGSSAFAVTIDGEIAGAGGITILDGVAMLSGAATQPKFRGRGVQQALIQARLQFAHDEGCVIAQVSTAPGTISQKNMHNKQFSILYARTKFVKMLPM
ncbi:MAG: GNAT family N-acetyltransferase [Candidatus Kapaibacteriota bacterium]